ncbi:MAG TPA: PfkB family carbohydrate kinase [Isosphaeraceae bacterium]|nr:PfkB family carbohydrate kinase [Isosphaeraceae bacterium]
MTRSRQAIATEASRKLIEAEPSTRTLKALVGLDGFVDEIIAVVDKRYADGQFDPVHTITAMGDKIRAAAGESSNYELVVRRQKLGGNGPIMAHALACLGLDVTYIGSLGYPEIHPVFREFAEKARVLSIAEAGHTDALEFDDGKIMLGKYESLRSLNWTSLVERVGLESFTRLVRESTFVGLVNWTMLPEMSRIWERMIEEVVPRLNGARPSLFVDLADPEKRTPQDIRSALALLTRFSESFEVLLGLNLKEAMEVAAVLNLPIPVDPEAQVGTLSASLRERLTLNCVVIHPRRAAAAATAEEVARFEGPFVSHPKISTGAGDHFNAGFCLGRILGLDLEESLCAGVACSGYYVRSAESPSLDSLAAFTAEMPPPEAVS